MTVRICSVAEIHIKRYCSARKIVAVSGRAKPDCVTFLKICEVLETSADQLLGIKSSAECPSLTEWGLIKKYRIVDDFGKKAVNSVLAAEYERVLVSQPRKPRQRKLSMDYYNYPASAGTGNFLESELPEKIWVNETPEVCVAVDNKDADVAFLKRVVFRNKDAITAVECRFHTVAGDWDHIVSLPYIKELGNKCLISHNTAI